MEEINTGHEMPSRSKAMNGKSTPVKAKESRRRRSSAEKYKGFQEAKQFAQSLQLKSRKEWRDYVKGMKPETTPQKPDDIPAHPDGIYKTRGWQGWRNWLGTDKPSESQAMPQ